MKFIQTIAIIIILTSFFSSCKKGVGEPVGPDSGGDIVSTIIPSAPADATKRVHLIFSTNSASGKKTSVASNQKDILWSEHDKLEVYSTQTSVDEFDHNSFALIDKDAKGGKITASFEGDLVPSDNGNYFAFYPAPGNAGASAIFDAVNSIASDKEAVFDYTLKNTIAYKDGSFATNALPTVAYSNSSKAFKFKHLCALLEIRIKTTSETTTIQDMTISSSDDFYPLCGKYSVSYNGTEWSGAEYKGDYDEADYKLYMNDINQSVNDKKFKSFWFVIPTANRDNADTAELTCTINTEDCRIVEVKSLLTILSQIAAGDHLVWSVDIEFSKDWKTMVIRKEITKDWPDLIPDPTEY